MISDVANWSNWNLKENNFKKYSNIKSNLIYGKHSKNNNKISIMIINYKRANGLKRALESAINQSYENNYEIIVVDDSGYDEDTDKLMKTYCKKHDNIVYYRHEKNLGQYANWNRACELCPTEWYCLLHDDDMLKPDYLTELSKAINKGGIKAGIIGIYFNEIDERKSIEKLTFGKKMIKLLSSVFIKIRASRPIRMKIKDCIKHIYISSCCLMINKKKVMDLGGLDDSFFPSSDFLFDSKMLYYYDVLFLPSYLAYRGIGENESLKQNVCDDSIKCAFYHTKAMANTLKYNYKKQIKKASIAAVIAEIGVKGYNNVDYGKIKKELGMKDIYNNKFVIFLINLYSKFNWGCLLFRRSL